MRYKLFWKGSERGVGGIGKLIFAAEQYIDKVVQMMRVSDRVILLKVLLGKTVLNVISAYAPQAGQMRRKRSSRFCWLRQCLS